MAKTRSRSAPPSDGNTTGLLVGAAGASVVAGAGGSTVTVCKSDDQTTYCKFVRWFNIFKMVFTFVIVFILAYFLYSTWKNYSKTYKR